MARTSHRRACSPESDKSEQNLSGNAKHKLSSPIRQQRRPPPVADEGRRCWGSGHKGVDICASAGTPIYASAGGTVTKAGYNKAGAGTGYGYSVIISHSGGYTTVYAHCLSLTVSAGQSVRQGQLIGYVGSTGRSSGNHCHFEIRRSGSYLAPQNFFPGKR